MAWVTFFFVLAFFVVAVFLLGFDAGTTLKLPLTLVNFLVFLSAMSSSLLLMVVPMVAMAFLMADREEPPRSLSVMMAVAASSTCIMRVCTTVSLESNESLESPPRLVV